MQSIIHHNYWYWGDSYIIILDKGKATVQLGINNENQDCGIISTLSVASYYRGKGYGNLLLEACENLAKHLKLSQICLYVEKDSEALNWYMRHNYKKDKYRSKYLFRLVKDL